MRVCCSAEWGVRPKGCDRLGAWCVSHSRIDPRAGWCDPDHLPRGPNDHALCRETLCVVCHRRATGALRRRLNAAKRTAGSPP